MTMCLFSCLVMPDSLQLHRLLPTSLLCPWDFPGKNIRVSFPSPENLPDPRVSPASLASPALQMNSLPPAPPGKPTSISVYVRSMAAFVYYVGRVHKTVTETDPQTPKHLPSCQLLIILLISNNCSNMDVNKTLQL